MSEARVDRLDRLDDEVREIRATLVRLEPMIIRIDAQLPQFATKADLANLATRAEVDATKAELRSVRSELADKPGKVFLATAIGVLLVAYAAGLAGLAAQPVLAKLAQ